MLILVGILSYLNIYYRTIYYLEKLKQNFRLLSELCVFLFEFRKKSKVSAKDIMFPSPFGVVCFLMKWKTISIYSSRAIGFRLLSELCVFLSINDAFCYLLWGKDSKVSVSFRSCVFSYII